MADDQASPTFKSFNPSQNPDVDFIKAKTDEICAYLNGIELATAAQARRRAVALTNYEQAAMWAVKSLFDR